MENDLAAGSADLDGDSILVELKARQRKRAIESEAEEQRALAKPKASKRQNKRTAGTASGIVEQPAAKKKGSRLSAESFAACAAPPRELDVPEAASSSSIAPFERRLKSKLFGIEKELKKLTLQDEDAWKVGDDIQEVLSLIHI